MITDFEEEQRAYDKLMERVNEIPLDEEEIAWKKYCEETGKHFFRKGDTMRSYAYPSECIAINRILKTREGMRGA